MKKYILLLSLLLAACAAEPATPSITPTATPNPGEIALNMIQQQMAAEATQQVVGLQFTATAQVIGQTATVQAYATQEAITQQAIAYAVSTAEQGRRDAAATQARQDSIATAERQQALDDFATEQAMIAVNNTQSALATSTFTAMTLTAIPPAATLTQIANEQIIAINADKVKQSNNDTNQQPYEWTIRLLVLLAALIVGAVMGIRWSRTREVKDEDGNVRVLVFDNKQVVSPRLLASPVLELDSMTMPELTPADVQAEVTKRAQMVDMVAAMPAAPSQAASDGMLSMFTSNKRFEMGAPPAELLPAETVQAIDADWKEGNDGQ